MAFAVGHGRKTFAGNSSSSSTCEGHSPKGLWVAKVIAGGGLFVWIKQNKHADSL